MTAWKITGKIIRTTIIVNNMHAYNGVLTFLGLGRFCVLCFCKG